VTQKLTATKNVNKSISREPVILLDLSNSRPTNFCCQLLRCLVCIVSWCTRSIHAMNDRVHGRKHGRVRVMDGPCTCPVHGRVHSLYMAVDGRIHGLQTRPCTGYTTVYTVVYLYAAVFTARVQGRPCTGYMTRAVYRLCTRPCRSHVHGPFMTRTRPCTAVYPVHGRVYGPCTQPCTDREYSCV